jgi:pilus assembly protein Flp/PilA
MVSGALTCPAGVSVASGTSARNPMEEAMKNLFQKLMKDESGASLIEYVLIAGLISIAGWGLLQTIGQDLTGILTNTNSATTAAHTASTPAAP